MTLPSDATIAGARRSRRKSDVVLTAVGRAPLDNILEILTMTGLVGVHVAAELDVPSVIISRLRHDCIGEDGFVAAGYHGLAPQDLALRKLCAFAVKVPPIGGWAGEAGDELLWQYITGEDLGVVWTEVEQFAASVNEYLRANKPPLVLARYLSGLSTGDFAQALGISRQRLHLIADRDLTDALCAHYLEQAVRLHLGHLTNIEFWGGGRWPSPKGKS